MWSHREGYDWEIGQQQSLILAECKLRMEISDNLKSCQVAKEGNIFTVWFLLSPWYEWVAVSSVTQSCPAIWDPMDCSTIGLPVYHQLLEITQTHVHWVDDAIPPSHPLLSPSPPAFNLSQHQSFQMNQFFASGSQSTGVSASASVLPMNSQDWFPLGWTGWISLLSKGLHSSKASVLIVLSFLYSPTFTSIHDYWKNRSFD